MGRTDIEPVPEPAMLAPLSAAECLLIRELHAPAVRAGRPGTILRLDS